MRLFDLVALLRRARLHKIETDFPGVKCDVEARPMSFAGAPNQGRASARIFPGAKVAKRGDIDRRAMADDALAR